MSVRHDTFTFRVTREERAAITRLAEKLQRSESDALRWLVRNALVELEGEAPVQKMDSQEDTTAG